jgi:prevent-host-death family protein
MHEFKRRLSEYVAQAEAGTSLLITRHRRIVAQLVPPEAQIHVGSRFGKGRLAPLLKGATKGRYLDVIADDRRGGAGER